MKVRIITKDGASHDLVDVDKVHVHNQEFHQSQELTVSDSDKYIEVRTPINAELNFNIPKESEE